MRPVQMVAVALIAQSMAGCSGSSIGPSGWTGPPPPTPVVSDPPKPAPIPSEGPKPVISAISPDTGSIYGGSSVTVAGEFDRRATATLGGIRVGMGSNFAGTIHGLTTPPHAAGPVDIVVTNPDGTSQTVVGGYTYVDPGAFDLDGSWAGFTVDGSDTWVEFTVREQMLTSVRCIDERERVVEVALSAPVVNGKIEFVGDAGRFSAWVASATEAAGTIDIAPCSGDRRWEAGHGRTY